MFFSAGNNGPGMNTAGDPGVATLVMSVGAYITDATYLADYGNEFYEADNCPRISRHVAHARGWRLQAHIVAPGAAISTIPMWQAQGCLASVCPVGYALFNGTQWLLRCLLARRPC